MSDSHESLRAMNEATFLAKEYSDLSLGEKIRRVVDCLRDSNDYNPTLASAVLDRASQNVDSYIRLGIKSFAVMEVTPGMISDQSIFSTDRAEYRGVLLGPVRAVRNVFRVFGCTWKVLRSNSHEPDKFWLVIYLC